MIIDNREIDMTKYDGLTCVGNKLIMLIGLPRSGKSTWARKQGYPIVSPDALRLCYTGKRWWGPIEHEVWATTRTMIRALFWAGNKIVILDSTGLMRKQRDMFIPSPDVDWKRYAMIMGTDIDICKKRAVDCGQDYLIEIINWMERTKEKISPDEGIEFWEQWDE